MSNNIYNVYVVDDDDKVLSAIRWLVESVGYDVFTFSNANTFIEEYKLDMPGCLVLDMRMPEQTGLEVQCMLKNKGIHIPIIFLTAHGDIPMATRALKEGALDFLTKPVNNQALLESINKAVKNDLERIKTSSLKQEVLNLYNTLTTREKDVLKLLVQGNLTKIIAHQLGISTNTAELHRASILKKMKVRNAVELTNELHKYDILDI